MPGATAGKATSTSSSRCSLILHRATRQVVYGFNLHPYCCCCCGFYEFLCHSWHQVSSLWTVDPARRYFFTCERLTLGTWSQSWNRNVLMRPWIFWRLLYKVSCLFLFFYEMILLGHCVNVSILLQVVFASAWGYIYLPYGNSYPSAKKTLLYGCKWSYCCMRRAYDVGILSSDSRQP